MKLSFLIFNKNAKLNTREIFCNHKIAKLNTRKMFFFSNCEIKYPQKFNTFKVEMTPVQSITDIVR